LFTIAYIPSVVTSLRGIGGASFRGNSGGGGSPAVRGNSGGGIRDFFLIGTRVVLFLGFIPPSHSFISLLSSFIITFSGDKLLYGLFLNRIFSFNSNSHL